jgi:hypothetical protein
MSLVVNSYFLPSYLVSCSEFATPAVFVGCVGLPWANLHWQLADTDDTYSLGHRVIASLEALPVIGLMVVLIECIVAAIVSYSQPSQTTTDIRIANPDYLFLARRSGRSQEGCCGSISVERADAVRQKLQEGATPGISFDSSIYRRCPSILGTCTVMSLEFATSYFRLRAESTDINPSNELFLDKLRQLGERFEISSEEIRSRQAACSSITVDRTVNMDVSRSKVQSWIKYYGFRTDHCSREMNITTSGVWQQEIDALPYGVYFVRMHKPTDNHKLEARGHSMIYVHEEGDIGFFYDNNWALEKISAINNSTNGTLLYERLLNVHRQWDIPSTRFYRLQPDT